MNYRDLLQRTINIISEANRYEREKMKGASAEAIASERTKRRFGRDVPGTEAARQKMHPRGEQRGGPGRKGVNTSKRTGSDPLAKREPKGNEPVTPAEAGPRKRETRRIEHLKAKVNLPEPKPTPPEPKPKKPKKSKPKSSKPKKPKKSNPKSPKPKNPTNSKGGKKIMENHEFNKEEFTKLLIESAAAYENKYRADEGYKKGTVKRAAKDALRGGADPEAVKKEGIAGETVRSGSAKFRGKGASIGFAKRIMKSHLPPKDAKLMRQGLTMEETHHISEGVKKTNKAKKREFQSKEGRKIDALTRDANPQRSTNRALAAARHSTGTTTERTRQGVEALQRGRFRDAERGSRQDEVSKYFDPNQRRTERRLGGQAKNAKADNPKALHALGLAAKVADAKAKFREKQIKKNQMDDSKYPFK